MRVGRGFSMCHYGARKGENQMDKTSQIWIERETE